jgi:hypothetical protein
MVRSSKRDKKVAFGQSASNDVERLNRETSIYNVAIATTLAAPKMERHVLKRSTRALT